MAPPPHRRRRPAGLHPRSLRPGRRLGGHLHHPPPHHHPDRPPGRIRRRRTRLHRPDDPRNPTRTRTWLSVYSTWRWTQTSTAYDSYGLPVDVTDLGDLATGTDDTCSHTTYTTRDTTRWMINYPAQVLTTDCTTPLGDANYLSGTDLYYDWLGWGVTPTRGLVTGTNALASVVGGVRTWKQATRATYDTNGRPIATFDELDHQTTIAYTPPSGSPVTQIAVTNPKGWTTTTRLDPGKGVAVSAVDLNNKITTAQYDPLGRLTKVWLSNRPSSATPDGEYRYNLSATTANSVESRVLSPS